MEKNSNFEDIIIISLTESGRVIHVASKITESCGIGDGINAHCRIFPTININSSIETYKSLIRTGEDFRFCGNCFPILSMF